jgi:response regulator RpfG family c-di-GMP phosphodiesterase
MPRTLLLVDDEENILRALTRVFRRDGYNLLTATSGAAGLDLLAQHAVGVVISDQRMPEMNGVEFLNHVKKQQPDTLRIVLSGYTELKSITDAINQGAVYKFLTKPWEDDLLRMNVDEAFAHYELRAENRRLSAELQKYNAELERRVAEKTRELTLNLHALSVAHDVCESLPLAVLVIDDDGMIVVANRNAHRLMGAPVGGLLGMMADTALPATLRDAIGSVPLPESGSVSIELAAGQRAVVVCSDLDETGHAHGRIVVLLPAASLH